MAVPWRNSHTQARWLRLILTHLWSDRLSVRPIVSRGTLVGTLIATLGNLKLIERSGGVRLVATCVNVEALLYNVCLIF